jgi:hypothetical protein
MSNALRVDWFERDPGGSTTNVAPASNQGGPRLVVVCGSISDEDRLHTAALPDRLSGHLVFVPRRDTLPPAENDREHRLWIDRADEVLAVRKPDGTVGESTAAEVKYALERGKPVRWWPLEASDD